MEGRQEDRLRYRIEYAEKHCDFANGSKELIERLKNKAGTVVDIRKLYKSGVSETVMEQYKKYMERKK